MKLDTWAAIAFAIADAFLRLVPIDESCRQPVSQGNSGDHSEKAKIRVALAATPVIAVAACVVVIAPFGFVHPLAIATKIIYAPHPHGRGLNHCLSSSIIGLQVRKPMVTQV